MSPPARDNIRYVAFLKGINVGGHTVKMDRLRALFEEIGHEQVHTHIASGNVIFSSKEEPQRLEEVISSRLAAALVAIAALRPFASADPEDHAPSIYVAFFAGAADAAMKNRFDAASTEYDRFYVDGSELYWLCRTRFSDSPFAGPALEKLLGTPATVRKRTTVQQIVDRYCVEPA